MLEKKQLDKLRRSSSKTSKASTHTRYERSNRASLHKNDATRGHCSLVHMWRGIVHWERWCCHRAALAVIPINLWLKELDPFIAAEKAPLLNEDCLSKSWWSKVASGELAIYNKIDQGDGGVELELRINTGDKRNFGCTGAHEICRRKPSELKRGRHFSNPGDSKLSAPQFRIHYQESKQQPFLIPRYASTAKEWSTSSHFDHWFQYITIRA